MLSVGLLVGNSIGGCAGLDPTGQTGPLQADPTADRLVEVAMLAADAWMDLVRIEAGREVMPPPPTLPAKLPAELARTVALRWTGPLAGLMDEIAARIGYSRATVGKPPMTPIIVTAPGEPVRVIDLIADIGWQSGTRATVEVDPAARAIRLLYPGRSQ